MREKREFTSRLSRGQTVAVLIWLPMHVLLLPLAATLLWRLGLLDEVGVNVSLYVVGTLYMLLFLGRFFRRDFDALCDAPFFTALEVLVGYGIILGGNLIVSGLMFAVGLADNPNNEAVYGLVEADFGPIAAITVFLAPLVEEPIFRAGIFGSLRRRSRVAAYLVSVLLFALCHVWAYALYDPKALLYLLQYLPAGIALARCYERTDSIWGSIFLHMLNNGVSILALSALR